MIKNLLLISALLALFLVSPVIVSDIQDTYLREVVTKKAHPVKIPTFGTVGSSWQVDFKGRRLTVTNNHVCSVVKLLQKKEEEDQLLQKYFRTIAEGKSTYTFKDLIEDFMKLSKKEYKVVGETLKIGDTNRKILYNSPNHDICFLEPVGNVSFSLASSVDRGEKVHIIGHPRGMAQSISDGRIVGEGLGAFRWIPKSGVVRYLTSTAISYPGNSGSPVVNKWGNVVGILFAGTSLDYVNINLVVPVEAVASELEAFINE